MEIPLHEIPADGLSREGELPATLFDLPADDPIRPSGPVRFSATIRRFGDLLVFHGSLASRFQLQCVRCLEYFDYEAEFPDWESDLELEDGQAAFDLGTVIREDFLLNLPSSPRCEDYGAGEPCPRAGQLDAMQRAAAEAAETEDASPRPDVWKALDELS